MLNKIKNFKSIIVLSFVCIFLCILTFLAFINSNILFFSKLNLQVLLILDVILLIVFLLIVIKKSRNLYYLNKNKKIGSKTSLRYISLFTLFTFHFSCSLLFHLKRTRFDFTFITFMFILFLPFLYIFISFHFIIILLLSAFLL